MKSRGPHVNPGGRSAVGPFVGFVLLSVVAATSSSAVAADVSTQAGEVEICLSPPAKGVPLWGKDYVNLLIINRGNTTVGVLEPDVTCSSCVGPCPDPRMIPSVMPRGWHRVEPGKRLVQSWCIEPPGGTSEPLLGEHPFSVSLELDFDGDYKGDKVIDLDIIYRVVEPPAQMLTLAQQHGEQGELCKEDGTRVKATTIPWRELDIEREVAIRDRIALPAPPMSPEESAKRMGRPPKPKDPADRKRLEEALRSDPEYVEWVELRASLGSYPYAPVNYESTLQEIRSAIERRWETGSDYFQETYHRRLDLMQTLGAGPAYRIQRALPLFLEHGKAAALTHLDAIAKEELRCADRAFLEDVRAIVVAAPDNLKYKDVVSPDTKR